MTETFEPSRNCRNSQNRAAAFLSQQRLSQQSFTVVRSMNHSETGTQTPSNFKPLRANSCVELEMLPQVKLQMLFDLLVQQALKAGNRRIVFLSLNTP